MDTVISHNEIENLLREYTKQINSLHRYSSFDYCFNYFQAFKHSNNIRGLFAIENKEVSSLQLAFYLASWGMYRGSTALLKHSSHVLLPVLEWISSTDDTYWNVGLENYETNSNVMKDIYMNIGSRLNFTITDLPYRQQPTAVLITKIMLGVFGNTPALDEFLMAGIGENSLGSGGYKIQFEKVEPIWQSLAKFYSKNKDLLCKHNMYSINFDGSKSSTRYSPAKIIDMVFFERGRATLKKNRK
jgi:hypothetical protein